MKHAAIFYIFGTVVILSICGFFWVYSQEQSTNLKLKDAEIQMLRKSNRKLEEDYKLRGDSIQIAFYTLSLRNDTIRKADKVTKQTITNHDKITFIRPASDSIRHRKLANLFPSYHIPR